MNAADAQGYVSRELTHFVGKQLATDEERFQLLVQIVRQGWVTFPPHDEGHRVRSKAYRRRLVSANEMYWPDAVCFCDIPLEHLALHMSKYSRFGLAFEKPFLVAQGATPVFYVAVDSRPWRKRPEFAGSGTHKPVSHEEWEAMREALSRVDETRWERVTRAQAIDDEMTRKWDLFYERVELLQKADLPDVVREHLVKAQRQDVVWDALVFGFLKSFEAGRPDADPKHYYLEREWRVMDNVEFKVCDIARIIIPHAFAVRLASEIADFTGPVTTVD